MKWYEEEKSKNVTTKACPECGNTSLVEISRSHIKICVDHKEFVRIPWYLNKGQVYKV